MMSSTIYNPNPTRVWSRVQNRCSTDTASSTVDYARIDYERQMLLKGNILQYKKNSSNLTKNQRYTQIAKGMWTNRTKTWATQSETYTNPNNSSLLRVNNTIVDPSNNTFSSRSNPFNCPTTEIPDGGNLVCNVVVDPCTQQVIKRTVSQQLCNPTTDSDVPGQIQQLCWNDGTQTWYPRQRYTMGNSGTSWPEGYKGFVSALTPAAPVLILDSSNNNFITLSWTAISNDCIPISSFNIYQNGILIANVLYPINTITIETCGGTFYVTSLSSDVESEPSNNVNFKYITTLILYGTYTCGATSIFLDWVVNNPCNIQIDSYNIYKNNALYQSGYIGNSYTDTGLLLNASYSYYIKSVSNSVESIESNVFELYTVSGITINSGIVDHTYNNSIVTITCVSNVNMTFNCPVTNAYILCIGGGGGGGGGGPGSGTNYGSGGGSGGIGVVNIPTITVGSIFNITIGSKGNKGLDTQVGAAGTSSSVYNGSNNIISSTGGGGGNTVGGNAGTSSSSYTLTSYNGGKGGKYNTEDGSSLNPTPIIMLTNSKYGGGGGGGGTSGGGEAGLNGTGGLKNSYTSGNRNGEVASTTSYGSGGGGGGLSDGDYFNGGDGAGGLVIIQFQYP